MKTLIASMYSLNDAKYSKLTSELMSVNMSLANFDNYFNNRSLTCVSMSSFQDI